MLTVSEPGFYRAMVTTVEGCVGLSNPLRIYRTDEVTAAISYEGDLVGCAGRSLILRGEAGGEWNWSDGTAADSLVVTSDGAFFIEADNGCEGTVRSDTLEAVFYNVPAPPVLDDVVVALPDEVVLMGNGASLNWYDAPGVHGACRLWSHLQCWFGRYDHHFLRPSGVRIWCGFCFCRPAVQDDGGYLENDSYWLKFDVHRRWSWTQYLCFLTRKALF